MVRFRFWRPLYHLSARSGAALIKARLWPLRASITGRALLLARGIFTVSVLLSGLSPSLSLSLSRTRAHSVSLAVFLSRARALSRALSLSRSLALSLSSRLHGTHLCTHVKLSIWCIPGEQVHIDTHKHKQTHIHTHTHTHIHRHLLTSIHEHTRNYVYTNTRTAS